MYQYPVKFTPFDPTSALLKIYTEEKSETQIYVKKSIRERRNADKENILFFLC